jgi:hypothetical protein
MKSRAMLSSHGISRGVCFTMKHIASSDSCHKAALQWACELLRAYGGLTSARDVIRWDVIRPRLMHRQLCEAIVHCSFGVVGLSKAGHCSSRHWDMRNTKHIFVGDGWIETLLLDRACMLICYDVM